MVIEVRLYATLRRYVPETPTGIIQVDIAKGGTVLDIVKQLKINPSEIHLMMINGSGCELDKIVNEGDRVGLFPPVGGG